MVTFSILWQPSLAFAIYHYRAETGKVEVTKQVHGINHEKDWYFVPFS